MAGSSPNGDGLISGINVTPLVDITLVLLIVFIVTAKIIVTPAVPIDLPKASTSEEIQVIFSVTIASDAKVLVDGVHAADDDSLRQLAAAARGKDPEVRAVISADGNVPHRVIIHVLDLLKSAEISKVAFGATPATGVQP